MNEVKAMMSWTVREMCKVRSSSFRRLVWLPALIAVATGGCSGEASRSSGAPLEANPRLDELASDQEALELGTLGQAITVDELAEKYLPQDAATAIGEMTELAKDVAQIYPGVSAAVTIFNGIRNLIGQGGDAPFEALMKRQLSAIQSQLGDIAAAIELEGRQAAGREGSDTYAEALWGSEAARAWVQDNGDAPLERMGGLASDIDRTTRVGTITFMDDAWYWYTSGGRRQFDHRLGLPLLVNAITARLSALAVLQPGFAVNGRAAGELLEYRDRLGALLAQVDAELIWCYPGPVVPLPSGSDTTNFLLRACENLHTGTTLRSTIGAPRSDASMRASLFEEFELGAVRELQDTLYALAHGFGTCHVGYAYEGGAWRRARIGDVVCSDSTLNAEVTSAFGVASDLPLLFGSAIATYGTENDRLGRFFIDRDSNMGWSTGDSNIRFMSDAQPGDQPFVIQLPRKLGTNCRSIGAPVPTVGIKRGGDWYIDTSGNGVWNGTADCDTYGAFGVPSDVPTPIRGRIAVSQADGDARRWWWDIDGSFSFTDPDVSFSFGLATDHPFSDSLSGEPGSQRGRQVFLNLDEDLNYSGGDVDSPPDYLPSAQWRFVGRFSIEPAAPGAPAAD
jgi:hypothetical protein